MTKIDHDESIAFNRLVIETTFLEKIGVFCIWIIGATSLPIVSLSMLYGSIKFNWFNDSAIQIIIAQIINFGIFIFVITGLIINRKLTKISVSSNVNTRLISKNAISIFKETFVEKDTGRELIVSIKPGLFASYRQLIFLFDMTNIYINCRTYARMELISPLHWIIHRKLIKRLKEEIQSTTAQHTV
jgi:hypothetical protein